MYYIRSGVDDEDKRKMNERYTNNTYIFNKTYKNIEFVCDEAVNISNKYMNEEKEFSFLDSAFL